MHRDNFLLLGADDAFLLYPADESLGGHLEVVGVDELFVVSGGEEGGLVAEVGDLGAAETWGQGGQSSCIFVFCFGLLYDYLPQVHVEYLSSALEVGQVDLHHAVESARSDQSCVEEVEPVSGGHYDYVGVGAEAVHLYQDLVEGVVPLVVGAVAAAPLPAHCVYLIDEDDGGRFLAGGGEEVADSGGTHAYEYLDEVGA
jgi:hypothetical protein